MANWYGSHAKQLAGIKLRKEAKEAKAKEAKDVDNAN